MSMDCEKVLTLIEKLVDDEAGPAEKREAETHLAACNSCREHFDFLTAVGTHYRAAELPEPPESYWEHLPRKIQKRIASEGALPERGLLARILSPPVLRFGALAATAVVVVAVGVNVLREDPMNVVEEAPRGSASPAAEVPQPPEDEPRSEPAPASPAPRLEEDLSAEAAQSLRSLGYVAGADEKPAEAATPPTEPIAEAETPEGLQSSFADTEGNMEERAEKAVAREQFAQLAVRDEPAPAAASGRAGVLRSRTIDDCERLREMLSNVPADDARIVDIRYELARCSIRNLPADASEERRSDAIADAEAFLALEADGPRAEEIREALRTTLLR